MSPGDVASLVGLGTAAGAAASAGVSALVKRRAASGKISTSDATVLWQQTQEFIRALQAELRIAQGQRDRLIELINEKLMPSMQEVVAGQRQDTEMIGSILSLLEGGVRAPVPAPPAETG